MSAEVHVIGTSQSNLPWKTDSMSERLTKQALSRCVAMAESSASRRARSVSYHFDEEKNLHVLLCSARY
jgi:hypothetical protein